VKRRGWDQLPLTPALTPVALAAPPTVKRRGWDQPPAAYPPAEAVALVSAKAEARPPLVLQDAGEGGEGHGQSAEERAHRFAAMRMRPRDERAGPSSHLG